MNKQSITRRAVFTGLAVAPVAACAPHAFADGSNPDVELIELREAHTRQEGICFAASDKRDEADRAAQLDKPEFPSSCTYQFVDAQKQMNRRIVDSYAAHTFGGAVDQERLRQKRHADLDRYEAQCRAVKIKHDVDGLDDIVETEFATLSAIEKKIIEMPARTIDGLFVKMALWHNYADTSCVLDRDEEFMVSAFEDAKRLSALTTPANA